MKMIKSILLTFLCAMVILITGYLGIIFSGRQILRNSTEPEQVTLSGNISNLFYSSLEDDIQLYPWNYYVRNSQENNSEDNQKRYVEEKFPIFTTPRLEYEVMYSLIALAADVEVWEVSQWYISQNKTIMDSMVQGMENERPVELFFYEEVIRLNGKKYQVQISCDTYSIRSFSCVQCKAENIKEMEQWHGHKERFIKWVEEQQDEVIEVFELIRYFDYSFVGVLDESYWYVDLYGELQRRLQEGSAKNYLRSKSKENVEENEISESIYNAIDYGDYLSSAEVDSVSIQMIEMKDCILLVMESDYTVVGIYYDVIEERISGFHFLG